jgi:predicted DNA-binding transcriptional regulator YafY
MRADRLVSLVLLLQSRGRMTAPALASELEVSVRTVYRDIAVLNGSGVPVISHTGPSGGCELLDGYRFPLRGLRPDEASALLMLGAPEVLRSLGLDGLFSSAQRQIQLSSGLPESAPLIHLDMPRWFRTREDIPWLTDLARSVKLGRQVRVESGTVGPLGLVNKAGAWYLVALAGERGIRVLRASRLGSVRVLDAAVRRPEGFDLARFWEQWAADFQSGLPSVEVRVRATPRALAVFPEVFGETALDRVEPPDIVTLSFEHEQAAAQRLAGFGGEVTVLSPSVVRDLLVEAARGILANYPTAAS